MKIFYLVLGVFLLGSCTNNDDVERKKGYAGLEGQYRIVSFEANEAVDLDNNKVLSRDLMTEVSNINNKFPFLEILPNEPNQTKVELLSFFFPISSLHYERGATKPYHFFFSNYGFNIGFEFKNKAFVPDEKRYIEFGYDNNVKTNHEVKILSDVEVVSDTQLKTTIEKSYYDFATYSWKKLNINVLYERFEY